MKLQFFFLLLAGIFSTPAGPALAQKNDGALFKKSEELHGVIGELSDQNATANICRKDGQCLPGDGSNIETGDTIEAPNLVTLYIEDPNGFSMHGLTGKVANTRLVRSQSGKLIVDITLSNGKMEGTIRELHHLIRIGTGYCLARRSDYVAEAGSGRGVFKIEKGSAECHDGKRSIKLDPRNPVIRWADESGGTSGDTAPKGQAGTAPDSKSLDQLPDIKPF